MKTILYALLFLAVVATAFVFISDFEQVKQTEANIRRYVGFSVFWDADCQFDSGTMDIDSNTLKVIFKEVDWPKLRQIIDADAACRVLAQTENRINVQKTGADHIWLLRIQFDPKSKTATVLADGLLPESPKMNPIMDSMMVIK